MEDGVTVINIISLWRYSSSGHSMLIQPAKQKLPNGKKIPAGMKIWVPLKHVHNLDELLKRVSIDNSFLNKLRFD
jgi:hypothetical protein